MHTYHQDSQPWNLYEYAGHSRDSHTFSQHPCSSDALRALKYGDLVPNFGTDLSWQASRNALASPSMRTPWARGREARPGHITQSRGEKLFTM